MSDSVPFWRRLYEGWLRIALCFGEVQTLVFLGFTYSFVIGPMATIAAIARRDLLNKRGVHRPESAWSDADSEKSPDVARAKRLF